MQNRTSADRIEGVTLEQLLQVKRCEQPSAEFWDTFESEFKARTVRELVKKPTVRDRVVAALSTAFTRWVPASAVAAIALSAGWLALDSRADSSQTGFVASEQVQRAQANAAQGHMSVSASTDRPGASQAGVIDTAALLAASDFTVDVVASPEEQRDAHFQTDFLPDVVAAQDHARMSYAEDVISSGIATLHSASFVLGM